MNSQQPSPLVPQGQLTDAKFKTRSRVRWAVFFVLAIHLVGLLALLMQGCRKEEPIPPADLVDTNALVAPTMDTTNIAPVDTNYVPNTMIETNPPIDTAAPVVTNAGGPAPAATTQGMTEYTIVKGDSFTSIGKKFQVSAKAIADANPGLDPTRLKLGQKINIPAPAPISAAPAVSNGGAAATADGQVVYTVQSGDMN